MIKKVAGHTFEETTSGRRCTADVFRDGSAITCNAHWLHVRTATPGDVNHPGYSHHGNLSSAEQAEIEAEKNREDAAAWAAVIGIAAPGG